jgi:hypothetical protein
MGISRLPEVSGLKRAALKWLAGIAFVGVVLVGAAAYVNLSERVSAEKPAEPDRVVGVTGTCTYTVGEGGQTVVREGKGLVCGGPAAAKRAGITVVRYLTFSSVVTVRTPQGGSYTVEWGGRTPKVGDPWPLPTPSPTPSPAAS